MRVRGEFCLKKVREELECGKEEHPMKRKDPGKCHSSQNTARLTYLEYTLTQTKPPSIKLETVT